MPFTIRDYDSWKLDTPPRFEGHPVSEPDDEPNDQDATPLEPKRDGEDDAGGGPIASITEIVPVAELRRAVLGTIQEASR